MGGILLGIDQRPDGGTGADKLRPLSADDFVLFTNTLVSRLFYPALSLVHVSLVPVPSLFLSSLRFFLRSLNVHGCFMVLR